MQVTARDINEKCRHYNLLLEHYGYNYTMSHFSIGLELARLWIVLNKEGVDFDLMRIRYCSPILKFRVGQKEYEVVNPVEFKERYEKDE